MLGSPPQEAGFKRVARKNKRKCSLFGMRFDGQAVRVSVDESVPKSVHGVPSEVIVRNRICGITVRVLFILEDTTRNLVIERSAREMRPNNTCDAKHWQEADSPAHL